MGATLDCLHPRIALGFINRSRDALVESAYVRVGGVGRAELVTLSHKLFNGIGEVRDGIWDVSSWDVYF